MVNVPCRILRFSSPALTCESHPCRSGLFPQALLRVGGHHMVFPSPDTCTAGAGEGHSPFYQPLHPSVLKKSLFSFSSGVDGVYMVLEMYGTSIGTSVLQAKRIYCRHF